MPVLKIFCLTISLRLAIRPTVPLEVERVVALILQPVWDMLMEGSGEEGQTVGTVELETMAVLFRLEPLSVHLLVGN